MNSTKKIVNIRRDHVDPLNPIQPINSGLFEQNVGNRAMLTFVPEGVGPATAGVFVLPPDGMSAREMAEQSNWIDLARTEECKEKFNVFFLEAENGAWRIDESLATENGETAYLQAAFDLGNERTIYGVHEAKFYLVGYGNGGVIAQKAAAENPSVYAGVVSVGSDALDDSYLQKVGASYAVDLGLFEDPNAELKIPRGTIPVPMLLIADEPEARLAQRPEILYWRKANSVDETPRRLDRSTLAFTRSKETPYPIDQDKSAHRVWVKSVQSPLADCGNLLNRAIWKDFLYPVRRWMSEPGGSLRMTEDLVRTLNCEYHYEMVGGWMREWYVYIPEAVRNHPETAVPLVFANHGYSCSGEIYCGNSGWNRVAEKYGFIVIFTSAVYGQMRGGSSKTNEKKEFNTPLPAWNISEESDRPDEAEYFRHMLRDACCNHLIDTSRVFVTGHSLGSLMTQYLATFLPDVFTAAAPCSGVLFRDMDHVLQSSPRYTARANVDIPVWMFGGEKEAWLLPHLPEKDNVTGRSIQYWWKLNHMDGHEPEDFSDGWKKVNNRWNDLEYCKGNIPMIRYSWIDWFPHATNIEMSFRIWEEFFSKLKRESDGTVVLLQE